MYTFLIYITLYTIINRQISCKIIIEQQNCTNLQDEFASAISDFTSCGIFHSRPINLCEKCVDSYIDLDSCYRKMNELKINDSRCIDYFVGQDRLQVVHTLYMTSVNLWKNAKCSKCFNIKNGQLTNNLSADTQTFYSLFKKTDNCLNNTSGIGNNITILCKNCMKDYLELDQFYKTITNENEPIGGCMDIVDLMNNTRKFWSINCCEYRKHNELTFLLISALVLLLTLIFYPLTQWCVTQKTPTLIKQRRFMESLHTNSNNHLND